MLVKGYKIVLDWFLEAASDPNYENPKFKPFEFGAGDEEEELEQTWRDYNENQNGIMDQERVVEIEDAAEGGTPKKQVAFAVARESTAVDSSKVKDNKENAN